MWSYMKVSDPVFTVLLLLLLSTCVWYGRHILWHTCAEVGHRHGTRAEVGPHCGTHAEVGSLLTPLHGFWWWLQLLGLVCFYTRSHATGSLNSSFSGWGAGIYLVLYVDIQFPWTIFRDCQCVWAHCQNQETAPLGWFCLFVFLNSYTLSISLYKFLLWSHAIFVPYGSVICYGVRCCDTHRLGIFKIASAFFFLRNY